MTMTLGTQTGSVMNHLMSRGEQIIPEVGMGVTILMWTDRRAATVIEVHANKEGIIKEIIIQDDDAARIDNNGMSESQTYDYLPNPNGSKRTARLLKGGWKILDGKDGESGRNIYGSGLWIGRRCAYHDYDF